MGEVRRRAAADAAHHLWWALANNAWTPEEVAEGAERLCTGLNRALSRWIGADGYHALLGRALKVARAEHASLADLSCLGGEVPLVTATAKAHGAGEVSAGLVTLVTALVDLLGRIVGEDMAIHLVSQVGVPNPRGVAGEATEGAR